MGGLVGELAGVQGVAGHDYATGAQVTESPCRLVGRCAHPVSRSVLVNDVVFASAFGCARAACQQPGQRPCSLVMPIQMLRGRSLLSREMLQGARNIMMRVHFTAEDLARVRLWVMGPVAETQWVLRILQQSPEAALFSGWRTQALRRSPVYAGALAHFLTPLKGGAADLFTMLGRVRTVEEGVDVLLHLPTGRLHSEFRDIPDIARRIPKWLQPMVSGDISMRQRFAMSLTECYNAFIGQDWPRIHAHLAAECTAGARLVAEGGVEELLSNLHSHLRWNSPVLEMPLYRPYVFDADLHLEGRGLILAPSLFCPSEPQLFFPVDSDGAVVLTYPASREPQAIAAIFARPDRSSVEALGDLLGRTRAALLEELDSPTNTTMLAKRLGVSAAAVSQHIGVLRHAGLVVSMRERNSVWHSRTPLSSALLEGKHYLSPCRRTS